MAHRHLAEGGVPALLGGPDQERGALDAVDARLAAPDVGGFFGLIAERQDARLRVEAGVQALRPLEGDLARQGISQEHRADEGAVVEEETLEDSIGVGARAQPLGPLLGPAPVAGLSGAVGGEPAQAIPEAAGPVPAGRGGPLARGRIAVVRKAVSDALAGRIDPAEEPPQPVLPRGARHAVFLPLLANARHEPCASVRRLHALVRHCHRWTLGSTLAEFHPAGRFTRTSCPASCGCASRALWMRCAKAAKSGSNVQTTMPACVGVV